MNYQFNFHVWRYSIFLFFLPPQHNFTLSFLHLVVISPAKIHKKWFFVLFAQVILPFWLFFYIKSFLLILLRVLLWVLTIFLLPNIFVKPFCQDILAVFVRFAKNDVFVDGLHPFFDIFFGLWGAYLHHVFLCPGALVNKSKHRIEISVSVGTRNSSQISFQFGCLISIFMQLRNSKYCRFIIICIFVPLLFDSFEHFIGCHRLGLLIDKHHEGTLVIWIWWKVRKKVYWMIAVFQFSTNLNL